MRLIKYLTLIIFMLMPGLAEVMASPINSISVGAFRHEYNDRGDEQRKQVTRYLKGVVEGVISQDMFTNHDNRYCFPEWVNDEAIHEAVLNHMLNNASNFSYVHYEAWSFLRNNFSCKSKG